MPRSHRGTGVSPVNDWDRSLCLASHLIPPSQATTSVVATTPEREDQILRLLFEVTVEPVERVGLHLTIELVTSGIKLRPVHLRRASAPEGVTQHFIGPLHFRHSIKGIFSAVENHRRRGRAQGQNLGKVQLPR